jgi:hypothetical protein
MPKKQTANAPRNSCAAHYWLSIEPFNQSTPRINTMSNEEQPIPNVMTMDTSPARGP